MKTTASIGRVFPRSIVRIGTALGLAAACGLASPAAGQVRESDHPAAPAAPQPAATNHLKFDRLDHDFGKIMDTADVEHVFRFTNVGDTTILLNEPKGSCGCTVPKMTKFEYAPGESGEIKVIFKPAGKAGARNTQTVTVSYHDTARPNEMTPTTTLTIFADVRTAVSVEPKGQVSFGEVIQGGTAKQVVTVTGIKPDFDVTYASVARSRAFDVKLLGVEPVEIDGEHLRRATLEVTLKDTSRRGRMSSIVTVRTTDPQVPLASVQLDAEIVGDIKVLPPRLNLGALEPKAAFERVFKVQSRAGTPFKILGIDQSGTSQPLTFDITPMDAGEGVGYSVRVKGVGPSEVGSVSATLKVKTDTDEPMEVALVGAVRPPPPMPVTGPMGPTIDLAPPPTFTDPAGTHTVPPKPGGGG